MDFFSFLCNLLYCSDSIISLCCSMNFSFKTLNSPAALLHASSFALVRISINCSPSLPNQCFMMGTLPSSLTSYVSISSKFATSISKFNSSTYLSGAFQLNAGWLIIGLACLGLWCSPMMLLLACGSAGRSASCFTLNTQVAVWIATCTIAALSLQNSPFYFYSDFVCFWIFVCLGVLLSV